MDGSKNISPHRTCSTKRFWSCLKQKDFSQVHKIDLFLKKNIFLGHLSKISKFQETDMNILGISAFYHDSAACLVQDGKIVSAAQEERITRKKHDFSFPLNEIKCCMREGNQVKNNKRSCNVKKRSKFPPT